MRRQEQRRDRDDGWGGSFWLSLLGHGSLILLIVFAGRLFPQWLLGGSHPGGAGQGTLQANLVAAVPGGAIPMPAPTDVITKNRLSNNNPGMTVTQPKPAPKPPPQAVPLPTHKAKPKPFKPKDLAVAQARRELKELAQADVPPHSDRRVPYGAGGPASFSYSPKPGVGGGGGMAFGDAAFGSLYTAWVNRLRDRLSYYWSHEARDPSLPAGRLVYVEFTIDRGGNISDIRFATRSQVPGLDAMAIHCVQVMAASEKLPLPAGYRPGTLAVRVSFELQ